MIPTIAHNIAFCVKYGRADERNSIVGNVRRCQYDFFPYHNEDYFDGTPSGLIAKDLVNMHSPFIWPRTEKASPVWSCSVAKVKLD